MADVDIITTGGTIDKIYDPLTGELGFANESQVGRVLEQGLCVGGFTLNAVLAKDSLGMTDEDRTAIVESCAFSRSDRIVLTHGTDTMDQTGQALSQAEVVAQKIIVLTGAMRPLDTASSDGPFNLAMAIAAAQTLERPGIYIAMHGRVGPHGSIVKDREHGVFVPAQTSE